MNRCNRKNNRVKVILIIKNGKSSHWYRSSWYHLDTILHASTYKAGLQKRARAWPARRRVKRWATAFASAHNLDRSACRLRLQDPEASL